LVFLDKFKAILLSPFYFGKGAATYLCALPVS